MVLLQITMSIHKSYIDCPMLFDRLVMFTIGVLSDDGQYFDVQAKVFPRVLQNMQKDSDYNNHIKICYKNRSRWVTTKTILTQ